MVSSVLTSIFQAQAKGFPSGGKERPSRGRTRWDVTVIMRTISAQKTGRADMSLGCSSQIMGLASLLGVILFFGLFNGSAQAGQSVTLAWEQNPEANVTGYRIHYGVESRTYANMVDAGNATSVTIANLVEGATYYFAATAYNPLGLESDYSDEISYTVPTAFARLQIRAAPAGQVALTVTGLIGHTYDIQATQDFETWTVIDTEAVGAGGSFEFTDTNAANSSMRFYRTRDIQL